jgi:hypothetical protein
MFPFFKKKKSRYFWAETMPLDILFFASEASANIAVECDVGLKESITKNYEKMREWDMRFER